jgi:hypothetical protein
MRGVAITKTISIVSFVLLCPIYWSGCSIFGIRPAQDIRALAVFNFEGKYGKVVSTSLCTRLDETERFECIDITTDISIYPYPPDHIESPEFLSLLQARKADAVFAGRVIASIADIAGIDKVPVPVGTGRYKQVRDPFGKSRRTVEIMRTVLRPCPYTVRRISITVLYKIVGVKTGEIVAAGKLSEIYEEKFGGKEKYDMVSRGEPSYLPPKDITMQSFAKRVADKLIEEIMAKI